MAADSLLLLTLSIWVRVLTDSDSLAGLTFLFITAPAFAVPIFGFILDRIPNELLLIIGNISVALFVLPLLFVSSPEHLWIIYAVAFAYGLSLVILPSAINGLARRTVPSDDLPRVNATVQTIKQGLRLIGPIAGAGLFAITGGIVAVVLVCVGLFAIATLVIATTKFPRNDATKTSDHGPFLTEAIKGFAHIKSHPRLRSGLASVGAMTLAVGFFESSIYAMLRSFNQEPTAAAGLVTAQGVGALIAGVSSAFIIKRWNELVTIVIGLTFISLSMAAIASAANLLPAVVASVTMGMGLIWVTVAMTTLIQRETASTLIVRVTSVVELFATGPQALSLAIGALLVSLISWRTIFCVMFVMIALATLPSVWALVNEHRRQTNTSARPSQTAVSPTSAEPIAARRRGGTPRRSGSSRRRDGGTGGRDVSRN